MRTHQYDRGDIDYAIEKLAEWYPKCFFVEAKERRPVKNTIVADLIKANVQLPREFLQAAVDFYQSNWTYQYTLQAGVRRIDLAGNENGTVTEQEQRKAEKFIHDSKVEVRERERQEREKRNANVVVATLPKPSSSISKLPMMTANLSKETLMPKPAKPNPLAPIQNLLDATCAVYEQQPEPLRRPFVVAGLREIIREAEDIIAAMEAAPAKSAATK